jgi:DNA-binding NtrC family response regulator
VIPITLPALRDRREDIPDLMRTFIERSARQGGVQAPAVPGRVQEAFLRHDWPGNIRELQNACERLVQTCFCGTVGTGCLEVEMLTRPQGGARDEGPMTGLNLAPDEGGPAPIDLDARLNELESDLLEWAVAAADGNKSRAAHLLKISRSTFGDRLSRSHRATTSDLAPS